MEANLLLESHLKTLRLTTFREQYRQVADDAICNNLSYDRYLLARTVPAGADISCMDKASRCRNQSRAANAGGSIK